MLTLDTSACRATILPASFGITDQELLTVRNSLRRMIADVNEEAARGIHGWMLDPERTSTVTAVREAAQALRKENIHTVVWVGIGGSGLGPQMLHEAFDSPNAIELLILDTIDPAALRLTLETVDWQHAAVVVASKSGGTLETMSAFFLLWETLQSVHGSAAAARVIAITDPSSGFLHDFSLDKGIRLLPIPPEVGGRFSIFSPVGLLPLALLDVDIDAYLQGAIDMRETCRHEEIEENPAGMLAAMQYILDTKKDLPIRVIMPYAHRLQTLGRWNQQLIAESLGKTEHANPIPVAALGTQDQHSLLQQWMQGPRMAWHLFVVENEKPRVTVPSNLQPEWQHIAGKEFGTLLDASYQGTSQGLTAAKRPHATLSLPRVDARGMGQLLWCLLTEVIFLGKLYRIDPYGQPGVELSKRISKDILSALPKDAE